MKINELITEQMEIWTAAQTPKRNGGRGRTSNGNGHSAHGIKRLRELILELAVRGKLVPQDPNDEPASVLLERIAKEKRRLIKEGKIKKQKPLPEIGEDEKPFELPEGWEWAKLGHLMEMFNGRAFKSTEWSDSGLPIIRIQNLNDPNAPFNYFSGETAEQHIVDDGTFLISWSGTPGTSFGAFIWRRGKAALNQHINKCLIFGKDSNLEFIKLSVNSCLDHLIAHAQGGVGLKHVTKGTLNNIVFGFPPLPEQHRIVTKVNELMTLCDQLEQQQTHSAETHQTLVSTLLATLTKAADPKEFDQAWQRIAHHFDTLFTTEAGIDQLKQTLLQLAVMGKLVPQDPNNLPAPQPGKYFVYALECEDKSIYVGQTEDVLKRWKQHATGEGAEWTKKHPPVRLVHWEAFDSRTQAVEREKELKTGVGRKWLKRELAAGRTRQAGEPASVLLEKITKEKKRLIKEGKIKKQKPLPEIGEDEKPFELPNGWEWARPDDFSQKITDGEHFRPLTQDQGIYFLSAKDIRSEGVSLENPLYISEEVAAKALQRCNPEKGDLLIVSRGATVGRMCTVDIEDVFCLLGSVILIKPFPQMLTDYLKIAMKTPQAFEQLISASGSTAQPAIYLKDIKLIAFPIAPFSEQCRIAAKVNQLMTLCDKLKARLNQAQTTQLQLADASVEQAVA